MANSYKFKGVALATGSETALLTSAVDETLIIKSDAVLVSRARIQFMQSAHNQKNDTLICKGVVEVCYFDSRKKKPKAFPNKLLALFGDIHG